MTKVVRFHEFGGPQVLRIEDIEIGAPGPNELRVRIEVIALNRAESLYRAGEYGPAKFPSLLGSEAVGVIEAVGAGVAGFAIGDRVCVVPNFGNGEYGVCAEAAIVPVRSVIHAPPELTPVQAASIWVQYCTAFALTEFADMRVGEHVLITAPSSSVGVAAIQLANWAGAIPIAATRFSRKFEQLKALGARHVIATHESDLIEEVMRITDGQGARIAFDAIAGTNLEQMVKAVADEGTVIVYGVLEGEQTAYPWMHAMFKGVSVRGFVFHRIWNNPERASRVRSTILRGLSDGHLRHVVSRQFTFDEIVDAYTFLESNEQVGKIVVTM